MLFVICLLFVCCNFFIQWLDFVIKLISFLMPIISLLLLSSKPCTVLFFEFLYFLLKFINISLVKSKHLLNLEVQWFYFFIFIEDLGLKMTLFSHNLLHVNVASLQKLIMRNMGQWCFRSMTLNFFLSLSNHSLQILLSFIILDCKISKSKLIIFSQI